MTKNMGKIDRIIRLVLAVVIAVLFFTGQITGLAAVILGIAAIAFIVSGSTGVCPLYTPLKISTICKNCK